MRVTEPETNNQVVRSKWAAAIAVLMIVLGIIALVFPFFTTIASTSLFGWVFIFAGIAQIVYAFQSRGIGQIVWNLILGLLYLLAGFLVAVNPLEEVLALTLVLGITILVQGIIQVSIAFQIRRTSRNWIWMLVSGLIGLVFGIVWFNVPSTAAWLIGTLVGINLLFDRVWMLTLEPHPK